MPSDEFEHDFKLGTSSTRIFDFVAGDGMSVLGGNCVGGGSVVYFATMPRAPRFVFERQGSIGRRMWPSAITRDTLEPWYDRVPRPCPSAGRTGARSPTPAGCGPRSAITPGGRPTRPNVAIDTAQCTNCNWMMAGCRFDAKRSLLLNYLPAAVSHGAADPAAARGPAADEGPTACYRVHYNVIDDEDYRVTVGSGTIDAKIVILAAGAGATPVILQRSEASLGAMPHAVGRYFSGNGERLNTAIIDEEKVRDVLGLSRPGGLAYAANQIGRGPSVASWDRLDASLPEHSRFSLEQLYFPPGLGTILAQAPGAAGPSWFGVEKKEMLRHWKSWLTIFIMSEDNNEGVFGPPPPTGNSVRISQQMLGRGSLSYQPTAADAARLGRGRRRAEGHPGAGWPGAGPALDQRRGRRLHGAPTVVMPHRR